MNVKPLDFGGAFNWVVNQLHPLTVSVLTIAKNQVEQ